MEIFSKTCLFLYWAPLKTDLDYFCWQSVIPNRINTVRAGSLIKCFQGKSRKFCDSESFFRWPKYKNFKYCLKNYWYLNGLDKNVKQDKGSLLFERSFFEFFWIFYIFWNECYEYIFWGISIFIANPALGAAFSPDEISTGLHVFETCAHQTSPFVHRVPSGNARHALCHQGNQIHLHFISGHGKPQLYHQKFCL